jgi:hypothetical protein
MIATDLTLITVVATIVGFGGLCVALGAIWKFIGIMSQLVTFVKVHTPILIVIAEQFNKNGGSSLKDQIDRIEAKAERASGLADEASKQAQAASKIAIETNTNVRQILRMITPKVNIHGPPIITPPPEVDGEIYQPS